MRGALAKLGGPMRRRLARDHVTDDAQGLVSNEQQPEVELESIASTSKLEVVCPPSDRPTKKKSVFVRMFSFRRRKSTSGSEGKTQRDRKRKEYKTAPEIDRTPATSCSGLGESDLNRLIEVDEPEVETPITDDVTSAEGPSSSAAILNCRQPEEDQTVGDGERPILSDQVLNDRNLARQVDDVTTHRADDDDVTRQDGETKKHRKRKRAKRYAKRVCISKEKSRGTSLNFIVKNVN